MYCEFLIREHEARRDKIIVFSDDIFALETLARRLNRWARADNGNGPISAAGLSSLSLTRFSHSFLCGAGVAFPTICLPPCGAGSTCLAM
jgi:hypothetical protein